MNRLTGITDPGSATPNTIFGYDAHDNRTSVTDSGGVETEFVYDDFGRRASRSGPDSGTTSCTYLPDDLVATRTDADGITLSYQYDALNRLTQILKNDGTPLVTYGYDETVDGVQQKGRLTSVTDASGNSSYLYNIHSELVKETRTAAGQVFVTEYGYTGKTGKSRTLSILQAAKSAGTETFPGGSIPWRPCIGAEPVSWLKTSSADPSARSPA